MNTVARKPESIAFAGSNLCGAVDEMTHRGLVGHQGPVVGVADNGLVSRANRDGRAQHGGRRRRLRAQQVRAHLQRQPEGPGHVFGDS